MVCLMSKLRSNDLYIAKSLLILTMFVVLGVLEYSTPSDYVFGYLYSGAILLVNSWFGEIATLQATFAAVFLTILNLWIPGHEAIRFSTIASRIIAAMALIVTGFLSQRLRQSQDAIALTTTKLETQEKLVRLREDFASTLTHDLKTPLLGAMEIIKAFQQEQFGAILPSQQQVLATMARSHETSLQLLETLLDVYRNDTEGLKLNLAPVDLAVLVEEAAITLTQLAASRRVHLSFNYGDSDFRQSLWVNGDALQLQRVLTNLLINAINHSRRGDRVEVILEPQTSYQVVKILDTGAGIKPEHFPYLFERFYQGNSDRQAKGFGLGLYLSRQIIEAHNGIIWAENRIPSGAIFSFKLPVLPFHPSVSASHSM
ncbi:sensor histidine kinase [Calothrix sp. PCC 6303]|uniref:sensor histidine kinase n=1 Tax=Calothrix sp. PCC 6303 TaxID=1170562 RepID=UPI0002A03FEC|nr:HAMP domain-containing sensor histidine kinase [Calothrix sp. PCC 6303]AFY99771.1 integral membrane sensor signal transduction histidine kinase [Calothrix sp. PCC 6303]